MVTWDVTTISIPVPCIPRSRPSARSAVRRTVPRWDIRSRAGLESTPIPGRLVGAALKYSPDCKLPRATASITATGPAVLSECIQPTTRLERLWVQRQPKAVHVADRWNRGGPATCGGNNAYSVFRNPLMQGCYKPNVPGSSAITPYSPPAGAGQAAPVVSSSSSASGSSTAVPNSSALSASAASVASVAAAAASSASAVAAALSSSSSSVVASCPFEKS